MWLVCCGGRQLTSALMGGMIRISTRVRSLGHFYCEHRPYDYKAEYVCMNASVMHVHAYTSGGTLVSVHAGKEAHEK